MTILEHIYFEWKMEFYAIVNLSLIFSSAFQSEWHYIGQKSSGKRKKERKKQRLYIIKVDKDNTHRGRGVRYWNVNLECVEATTLIRIYYIYIKMRFEKYIPCGKSDVGKT